MRSLSLLLCFAAFCSGAQSLQTTPDFRNIPVTHWKFRTTSPILSSPVIDGNVVYFGGTDSTLYALDLNTGKVLWKKKTRGEIRSTVAIASGELYLNGGDGNLYSLDKKSGTTKWTFAAKGEKKYDFADYHQSSPILYNNRVYFGAGEGLYAVEITKGQKVWAYETTGVVHGTPVIAGDKIFVGSFDGNVYALDANTGNLLWKFKTVGHRFFPKGEVQGSPVASKGVVIVGARDYNVYALDQNKGFSHWNKAFPRGWVLTQTLYDSVVHMAGADERILMAVDPATGREFWKQKMEFLVFGKNVYSENMMYVGTTIGKLHGIDTKTGEKVWTFTTDGYQKNRLKYFKEDDSYRDDIYSIIKSNEHFLEAEYELGGIFSSPAISKDFIVITTTEGFVYCLKRN